MSGCRDITPGGTASALRRLADGDAAAPLAVADLLAALGDQGFGLLILLLALPNAIPGPLLPGFSVPFALGIAALGLQLALGWPAPRLPTWVLRRPLRRDRFRRFIDRAEPLLRRVERWVRPRPSPLTHDVGERLMGLLLVALSVVLAFPIPFGNVPIALSIIVIACGLLEADGVALLVGVIAGGVAAAWNAVVVFAGAELIEAAGTLYH